MLIFNRLVGFLIVFLQILCWFFSNVGCYQFYNQHCHIWWRNCLTMLPLLLISLKVGDCSVMLQNLEKLIWMLWITILFKNCWIALQMTKVVFLHIYVCPIGLCRTSMKCLNEKYVKNYKHSSFLNEGGL